MHIHTNKNTHTRIYKKLCPHTHLLLGNRLARQYSLIYDARSVGKHDITGDEICASIFVILSLSTATSVGNNIQQHNITHNKIIARDSGPFSRPEHLDRIGFSCHLAKLIHGAKTRFHDCRLEEEQHEKRENTVVPHVVQTPQQHTEDLTGVGKGFREEGGFITKEM